MADIKNPNGNLVLVADGGSTKTDWLLAGVEKTPLRFRTRGLNPALADEACLKGILQKELSPQLARYSSEGGLALYYYGAGCLPDTCPKMERALSEVLPAAHIEVRSDLLGAARALCGHRPGIACILGTGSNSCRYDGRDIVRRVPSLGYILGDEGSGTALGKRLIGDWLKGLLDEGLDRGISAFCGLDEAGIIQKVYREPEANRFLASFTPFLEAHRNHPLVHRIITDCFHTFFERNVVAYRPGSLPIHFVGSIALIFKEELEETANRLGLHLGKILKEPVTDMLEYHLQPPHPPST